MGAGGDEFYSGLIKNIKYDDTVINLKFRRYYGDRFDFD